MADGGIDADHVRQATKCRARVLYSQNGIHNPTGLKLAPGPAFSTYDGLRSHLRLPIWHEADLLEHSLHALSE